MLLKRGKTGGAIWALRIIGTLSVVVAFCHVLHMSCRGHFMWPLAVAGLGLRYLRTKDFIIFGNPLTNPLQIALSSKIILGLHSDWWEIFMVLAWVCTECVNVAKN